MWRVDCKKWKYSNFLLWCYRDKHYLDPVNVIPRLKLEGWCWTLMSQNSDGPLMISWFGLFLSCNRLMDWSLWARLVRFPTKAGSVLQSQASTGQERTSQALEKRVLFSFLGASRALFFASRESGRAGDTTNQSFDACIWLAYLRKFSKPINWKLHGMSLASPGTPNQSRPLCLMTTIISVATYLLAGWLCYFWQQMCRLCS